MLRLSGLVGLAFLALGVFGCQGARLMVDQLIARVGFARLVDYFREFSLSGDGDRNFERVFGRTLGAFESEGLEGLATPRQ